MGQAYNPFNQWAGHDQTRAASWRGRCRVLHRRLGGTQWRQRPHSIHANGSILPVVVCVLAHRNCKRRIYPSRGKESRFSIRSAALERSRSARLQGHAAVWLESESSYHNQRNLPWAPDYGARVPAAQNFVPKA